MKKVICLLVGINLISLFGCEHRKVTIAGVPATPYHKTQNKMTQYKKMFGLEKVIYHTYVTYFSDQMRIEYVDEYAHVYKLSEDEKDLMMAEIIKEGQEFDMFFIAHFSSDIDYQAIQSQVENQKIWTLRLEEQNDDIRPLRVESMRMTAQQVHFFPQLDGFTKMYRAVFRKTTQNTKTLRMSSPATELVFHWKDV